MLGVVGCGAMGGAIVARLLECGHSVACYDALPEARERVKSNGARVYDDLVSLAKNCRFIILSLPKAAIVEAVMEDLSPAVSLGSIVLDTSTSVPGTTKDQARKAEAAGYSFIDGPVSGGPSGARQGTMTMVLGGHTEVIDTIRPILKDMTAKLVHVGPVGAGHAAKIANNMLCAANLVLVTEMAKLAAKMEVPLENLLEGINAGSGRSGVSEVNFPKWIQTEAYDSGFTMGLMRKDVGLAVELAEQNGLELPVTSAIAQIWETSRDMLPDSADFNEIFKFGNL